MAHPRKTCVSSALGLALSLAVYGASGTPQPGNLVLARVEVSRSLADIPLPVHAHLQDSQGRDYALVLATVEQLKRWGQSYQVLDGDAGGATFAIAEQRQVRAEKRLESLAKVLYRDGRQVILRSETSRADALAEAGLEFEWLSQTPIVREVPQESLRALRAIDPHPAVAEMIKKATQTQARQYLAGLTGVQPVNVGGADYIIATRHTNSGTPIQKATQYAYEFMQSKGLEVSYHTWNSGRNVVGVKKGTTKPEEIVVIVAHLDDMPSGATAPGADDNGTGSVGVLMAAEMLSQHTFERTLRFVLVTGEEQGLLGSAAYATACKNAGDKIIAVHNMDMVGTDNPSDGPMVTVHTRTSTNPGYAADYAIATTFADVVKAYQIAGVQPVIKTDGAGQSDHVSFWNKGYPGVMAIEEDFSPNYHTVNDKLQTLSMPFFTAVVQASGATVAHLAIPAGQAQELRLTTQPEDQVGLPGNSVTFTAAVAGGTAPYRYQWWKNGAAVAGATGASYSFVPQEPDFGSRFKVVVSDSAATPATVTSREALLSKGTAPSECIKNGSFEEGVTPWAGTTAVIGDWSTTKPAQPAYEGKRCAFLGGKGKTTTQSLYQTVSIPAAAASATLGFYLHIDTKETGSTVYDKLAIQVRDSSGTLLKTLATYSNVNAAVGYQARSFDVSAYKGKTLRIQWAMTEDASLQTSFVVDKVSLIAK